MTHILCEGELSENGVLKPADKRIGTFYTRHGVFKINSEGKITPVSFPWPIESLDFESPPSVQYTWNGFFSRTTRIYVLKNLVPLKMNEAIHNYPEVYCTGIV